MVCVQRVTIRVATTLPADSKRPVLPVRSANTTVLTDCFTPLPAMDHLNLAQPHATRQHDECASLHGKTRC
jgi:hypothetical protein